MNILWIPHTGWHIPQRAHFFCKALSELHDVHVTDWVADFSSIRDYVSYRYIRNFMYRRYCDGLISVHGIPRISPAIFTPALRHFNTVVFSWFVQRIIERYKINVVVGTFVVPPPQAPRLVFDVFDDNPEYWMLYRNNSEYAREISEIEKLYIQQADSIVTVSSVLYDKVINQLKGLATNVTIIPNGVDLAVFQKANGSRIRDAYQIDQKTVIGFISSMGEFSGLIRLINAFTILKETNLALLIVGDGPLLKPAKEIVRNKNIMGVYFTGNIPYHQIADYYSALDVGVIPFDVTSFTSAACPIKLLEYTAAQKIVISTELEEIKRMGFSNVIFVKDNARSMAEGIKKALDMLNVNVNVEQILDYDLPKLVSRWEKILKNG